MFVMGNLNQQNNQLISAYLYCDNRKKEQFKRTPSKFLFIIELRQNLTVKKPSHTYENRRI